MVLCLHVGASKWKKIPCDSTSHHTAMGKNMIKKTTSNESPFSNKQINSACLCIVHLTTSKTRRKKEEKSTKKSSQLKSID